MEKIHNLCAKYMGNIITSTDLHECCQDFNNAEILEIFKENIDNFTSNELYLWYCFAKLCLYNTNLNSIELIMIYKIISQEIPIIDWKNYDENRKDNVIRYVRCYCSDTEKHILLLQFAKRNKLWNLYANHASCIDVSIYDIYKTFPQDENDIEELLEVNVYNKETANKHNIKFVAKMIENEKEIENLKGILKYQPGSPECLEAAKRFNVYS